MPEPLAETLRRLHREATPGPWAMDTREPLDFVLWGPAGEAVGNVGGLCVPVLTDDDVAANPEIHRIVEAERRDITLIATLRNALPALADIVAAGEAVCRESSTPQIPLAMALAALREQMGRRP